VLLCVNSRALDFPEFTPGAAYANDVQPRGPWSIHVVRIDRSHSEFEVRSAHAFGLAMGLATLSNQLHSVRSSLGSPIAGVNGDFYERGGPFAGDTRGLQIIEGELISAPANTASFWIDATGEPHLANTISLFAATFPNGKKLPFGLNEERAADAVLYTPAMGGATRTRGGVDVLLERNGDDKWLPVKIGETYSARVRWTGRGSNSVVAPDTLVLSIPSARAQALGPVHVGDVLKLSTACTPNLSGARTAVSAGPMLLHGGKKQDWISGAHAMGPTGAYSVRSMSERHPRSGLGWNEKYFYLVEVDGRQPGSAGMTLDELAAYFRQLGCEEAMNLDGGGSATMWANGHLVNRPSDPGYRERVIANSLLITRKPSQTAGHAQTADAKAQ
jgi:hypothetical protein